MNCVCQNGPQRPGIQEVLDTIQGQTVCVGTQCFETEADAFGLQAPPQANNDNSMFFFMMMCAANRKKPPPHISARGGGGARSRRGMAPLWWQDDDAYRRDDEVQEEGPARIDREAGELGEPRERAPGSAAPFSRPLSI